MKYTIEYHSDIEDDMDWFDIESKNYLRDVVLTIEIRIIIYIFQELKELCMIL